MFTDFEPKIMAGKAIEGLKSLKPDERTYYAGLSIFVAANIADLLTTNVAMQSIGTLEVNPFMKPIMEQFGVIGMTVAKAAGIITAMGFAEVIRRRNYLNLSIKTLRGNNLFITGVAAINLLQTVL